MKKLLEFLFGKKEKTFKRHKGFHECDFGIKEFNKTKRSKEFVDSLNEAARPKGNNGKGHTTSTTSTTTTSTTTVPTSNYACLFLAFNGGLVSGTSWNLNGDFTCQYSGLAQLEIDAIVASVQEDYAPWKIEVTTDENVFNSYPANRKSRCLITETYEWYGNGAGGVSFIGSLTWGDNTPCFVFSSLLGYNTKFIKEAISHELGHSIGLYHQAKYDEQCNYLSDYNSGCCGQAPIMGVGYYQPDVHWWVGPTPDGCHVIQDDIFKITTIIPLK